MPSNTRAMVSPEGAQWLQHHVTGWNKHVQHLTDRVKADLGVPDAQHVEAQLYKMLLYQEGDHFAPHRDTEKAPGMFATMTLLLPSQHEVH